MPKARKTSTKKITPKGGRKTVDSNRTKLREAVNRTKQIKKDLTAKLKAKTAEFKKKIQEVESLALAKALETLEREVTKKEEAKKKILAAAEEKFEKRYAKKGSKHPKKKPTSKVTQSAKKPSKASKRGRPTKPTPTETTE